MINPTPPKKLLLTINGGSSSIKFGLFQASRAIERLCSGAIDGIGSRSGSFSVEGVDAASSFSKKVPLPDHPAAARVLTDWLTHTEQADALGSIVAVGHRIVHGGPKYWNPTRLTPKLIAELRTIISYDPEHLPDELALAEVLLKRFPQVPHIACFDTAFHHELPEVARVLPIPWRYYKKGVRRYGFHGLSCAYLIEELRRVAGPKAANGRVIIAHLGNGASITAVRQGKSIDTSMSFTPTGGFPMSTRAGDLDPAIAGYLFRSEKMTPQRFNRMVTKESGLLGISGGSPDIRELMKQERKNPRAALAANLFCYQARKWVAAMVAAMNGCDTLVFAGGIGEHNAAMRARMCAGLGFLGLTLDAKKNRTGTGVISTAASAVTVRVMHTDEERFIAQTVNDLIWKPQTR